MTRREIERYRAAAMLAVNAFFDGLAADAGARRTVVRVPAQPDGAYDDVAKQRAEAIALRHGVG